MDWLCEEFSATPTSLAAGAQATVSDELIDHPSTGETYGSGAVFGLRAWVHCFANGAISGPVEVVCMVLPNGVAVPSMVSATLRKTNEDYVWWRAYLKYQTTSGDLLGEVAINTARSFRTGDRLVLVIINKSATNFGAGARCYGTMDAYVRET